MQETHIIKVKDDFIEVPEGVVMTQSGLRCRKCFGGIMCKKAAINHDCEKVYERMKKQGDPGSIIGGFYKQVKVRF